LAPGTGWKPVEREQRPAGSTPAPSARRKGLSRHDASRALVLTAGLATSSLPKRCLVNRQRFALYHIKLLSLFFSQDCQESFVLSFGHLSHCSAAAFFTQILK
jgi:hypothetical protein